MTFFIDFKDLKASEKSIETRNDDRISVTQRDRTTTIFQTSPSTTFYESLLVVTSSPTLSLDESEENIITNAEGSQLSLNSFQILKLLLIKLYMLNNVDYLKNQAVISMEQSMPRDRQLFLHLSVNIVIASGWIFFFLLKFS